MTARQFLIYLAAAGACYAQAQPKTIEIPFTSHDGHALYGKLSLPHAEGRHAVVIYVQTAEGSTVDMRRPKPGGGTFNYYDLYREKLAEMNIAFFSYEGRGIRMGDQPPRYEHIERKIYDTSTLDNKVRDILSAVAVVKKQKGVDAGKIFLMGASEGTMLAAEAASRAPEEVHGLVLYAVLANTLKDALKFMASDGNFMVLRSFFDTDKDGKISKEEFDADARKLRERAMKGVGFETFDLNGDGVFVVEEMRDMRKKILEGMEKEDIDVINLFLKPTAAVSTPEGWLKDHFAHAPMWTFLEPLKIPVGLFHGSADNLTSIEGVKDLEERARKAGKSNMKFHYFEGLDHTLGITAYFMRGTMPAGHKAIFEYIKGLAE